MATPTNTNALNASPQVGGVVINSANPYRDGSGALGTVFQAYPGSRARIEIVRIVALGGVGDGMIRLFYSDGANNFLIAEIPVQATNPSPMLQGWHHTYVPPVLLVLPPSAALKASTERSEPFALTAFGWTV